MRGLQKANNSNALQNNKVTQGLTSQCPDVCLISWDCRYVLQQCFLKRNRASYFPLCFSLYTVMVPKTFSGSLWEKSLISILTWSSKAEFYCRSVIESTSHPPHSPTKALSGVPGESFLLVFVRFHLQFLSTRLQRIAISQCPDTYTNEQ